MSNTERFHVTPSSDHYTSPRRPSVRLKTDNQQTSFEENRQFRFFEDLSVQQWSGVDNSIASGDIVVYRFTSVNALNIQARIINGWAGGRKYLVFPADGNETITGGAFADVSDQISVMSNNLADDLTSHPLTGVTIEKRIATAFTSTTKPRTGVPYKADSNQNRNTSSYSPSGSRAGVGAGGVFYLVLFDITSGSTASQLLLEVEWEELFD